jgi:hypothetical protein
MLCKDWIYRTDNMVVIEACALKCSAKRKRLKLPKESNVELRSMRWYKSNLNEIISVDTSMAFVAPTGIEPVSKV